MNEIVILCCIDLSMAQYIYKYFEVLDEQGYSYDVIYWNRSNESISIKCNGRFIPFNKKINSYLPFKNKIISYIRFSFFVEKLLHTNNYKKIICLTSPMAVCVSWSLLTKYKYKYLYDFRDLTKESYWLYRKFIQLLAYSSQLFVVSSLGYLKYFDCQKITNYCLCHNSFSKIKFKQGLLLSNNPILRITYWGSIRQLEYNKKVCDFFGNKPKVTFTYHGSGCYTELMEYCKSKGYSNIHFTGKYHIDEISKFANETDILFCAYERDFVMTQAMAVKVYDSLEYKLPIIVTIGTFMHDFFRNNSCVMAIDIEKSTVEEIYKWYYSLNREVVEEELKILQYKINTDENVFRSKLINYLEN